MVCSGRNFLGVVFSLALLFFSQGLRAQAAADYAVGANLGVRQLDFNFTSTALPSYVFDSNGQVVLTNTGGEVELNVNEALYVLGAWGGVFIDRFSVTGLIELATEEDTSIEAYSQEFASLSDDRSSELSRIDYSVTLAYEIGPGLNIFSGVRHAEFTAKALEDNFLLGRKDQTYVEQGFFIGTSYSWHVSEQLTVTFSTAYAYLDLDFSEENVDRETSLGPVALGEFSYKGTAQGLSYGIQFTVPISEHWYYSAGVKHQEYVSDNNRTSFEIFPRVPGLVASPVPVVDLDTEHADTLLNFGVQYLF